MADFSLSQSFSTTGLCATLVSTDTTNYGNNDQGITASDVLLKVWTFRNASGTIIKQFTGTKDDYSCDCAISLLTLFISVDLRVEVKVRGTYNTQTSFNVPCLLV